MSLTFLPFSQSSKEYADDLLEILQTVCKTKRILLKSSPPLELASELENAETILKGLWLKIMTEDLEELVVKNLVKMKMTHLKSEEIEPNSDNESEEDSQVVETAGFAA